MLADRLNELLNLFAYLFTYLLMYLLQDETVMTAMSCIVSQENTADVYTLSLISYAYCLYGMDVTRKRNVLDRLRAKVIRQGKAHIVNLEDSM